MRVAAMDLLVVTRHSKQHGHSGCVHQIPGSVSRMAARRLVSVECNVEPSWEGLCLCSRETPVMWPEASMAQDAVSSILKSWYPAMWQHTAPSNSASELQPSPIMDWRHACNRSESDNTRAPANAMQGSEPIEPRTFSPVLKALWCTAAA